MKLQITRWSIAAAIALALTPSLSYARPIPTASHGHESNIRDRGPRIHSHESFPHHA